MITKCEFTYIQFGHVDDPVLAARPGLEAGSKKSPSERSSADEVARVLERRPPPGRPRSRGRAGTRSTPRRRGRAGGGRRASRSAARAGARARRRGEHRGMDGRPERPRSAPVVIRRERGCAATGAGADVGPAARAPAGRSRRMRLGRQTRPRTRQRHLPGTENPFGPEALVIPCQADRARPRLPIGVVPVPVQSGDAGVRALAATAVVVGRRACGQRDVGVPHVRG